MLNKYNEYSMSCHRIFNFHSYKFCTLDMLFKFKYHPDLRTFRKYITKSQLGKWL